MNHIVKLGSNGEILRYRAEIKDDFELEDGEQVVPIQFLGTVLDRLLYIKDGVLVDENGDEVVIEEPSFYSVINSDNYTKLEWLEHKALQIFEDNYYKIYTNPDIYYCDVDELFSNFPSSEPFGEVLRFVPKFIRAPIMMEGSDKISKLFDKFSELHEVRLQYLQFLDTYDESDSSKNAELDELVSKFRAYI
jgi:hypothetical protein